MPSSESAHETFMRRAIELAKIALSKGDTPVGSLTVRDGRILAEGIEAVKTRIDISAHVEMIAIRQACRALGTLDLSVARFIPPPNLVLCVRTRSGRRASAR